MAINRGLSPRVRLTGLLGSAIAVFALAAVTDWLDGYLARKQGLTSTLGRNLAPALPTTNRAPKPRWRARRGGAPGSGQRPRKSMISGMARGSWTKKACPPS